MPDARLPRITVITPSLNQAEYLERTMCSVLDQGYDNLEYIVVDGGSCDGSAEIIQLYEHDLAYWHSAPDDGPADAINRALDRATGDIVAILNADDLMLPGTLHDVAKRMTKPDAPVWIVGHCLRIGERDERLGQINATSPDGLAGFLMQDNGQLPAPATFYRRSIIEAHGRFDPQLQFAWHYELNCRLIAEGVMPTIYSAILAAHREYARSKSAQNTFRSGPEYAEAAARYAEYLPLHHRHALASAIQQCRQVYELARQEVAAHPARRHLWNQLLRRPWWLTNDHYRKTLLHGITHPDSPARQTTPMPLRLAA